MANLTCSSRAVRDQKPLVIERSSCSSPRRTSAGPVGHNGVCHSDYHLMSGDSPPLPVVLGHGRPGSWRRSGGWSVRAARRPRVLELHPSCGKCGYIGDPDALRPARQVPLAHARRHVPFLEERPGAPSVPAGRRVRRGSPAGGERHSHPQGRPARRGLAGELRCPRRTGPVINKAKVPRGQRGRVRLRWRRPQHDPGGAPRGRGADHRRGRDEAEARVGPRVRGHPWWTPRRATRSPRCRIAGGGGVDYAFGWWATSKPWSRPSTPRTGAAPRWSSESARRAPASASTPRCSSSSAC